jgi:hypothetical protein
MQRPAREEIRPEPVRRQELWRELLLGEDPRVAEVAGSAWVVGAGGFRLRMRQLAGLPARPPAPVSQPGARIVTQEQQPQREA